MLRFYHPMKNGEEFKALYPSDDRFQSSFQYFKMPSRRSSKKIRFLLSQIEIHNGNHLAQEVSKYKEWTLASVNKHQEWLASQAVQTWRVD